MSKECRAEYKKTTLYQGRRLSKAAAALFNEIARSVHLPQFMEWLEKILRRTKCF